MNNKKIGKIGNFFVIFLPDTNQYYGKHIHNDDVTELRYSTKEVKKDIEEYPVKMDAWFADKIRRMKSDLDRV